MRPDFALLDSFVRAPQIRLKVAGLHHTDLITFGFAGAALPAMGAGDREAAQRLERSPGAAGFDAGLLELERRPTR